MVVGAARRYLVALVEQRLCHGLRIGFHLLGVFGERWLQRFAKCHRLSRYHVLQRATLHAGEHGAVEQRRHLAQLTFLGGDAPWVVEVLAHQYYSATRTAQGLVGGGGHYVRVAKGVVEQSGGYQACRVSHVYHQDGSHTVGNSAHTGVVPFTAVRAGATHYQFGTLALCHFFHHIIVHQIGVACHVILTLLIYQPREVNRATVRQVATMCQVQAHKLVSGLHHGHKYCHVGLGTAMRLHVGILRPKQAANALYSHILGLIHHLATTVITVPWVALGIFVGQATAHRLHHLLTHKVLACYQLYAALLALVLTADNVKNHAVMFHVAWDMSLSGLCLFIVKFSNIGNHSRFLNAKITKNSLISTFYSRFFTTFAPQ